MNIIIGVLEIELKQTSIYFWFYFCYIVNMTKRTQEIIKLYKLGETLRSIGEKFNISRQRVWQIIYISGANSISKRKRIQGAPTDSEKHIARILRRKKLKVEHASYNNVFDLLVMDRVRIEVKHRGMTGKDKIYRFTCLNNKNFDVLIAVCGDYKSHKASYYIFPSSAVKNYLSIPKNPISNTRKQRLYRDKWDVIQRVFDEIVAKDIRA